MSNDHVYSQDKESFEAAFGQNPANSNRQQQQQQQQQPSQQQQSSQSQPPHPPSAPPQPPHPHRYHHPYPPPPPHGAPYPAGGPYSAAMGKPGGVGGPYHHPPPTARPPAGPASQGPAPAAPPNSHLSSPRHSYEREDHGYHRQLPVRGHEADYRGHPPAGGYQGPPPPHYGPPPEDRRWMGPEGVGSHHPPHRYGSYDGRQQSFPPPPPPPVAPGHHMPYRYPPHPVYPNNRLEENSRIHSQPPAPPPPPPPSQPASNNSNDVDGREGATSPSQIELSHRDEVTNMGCTCKKTKCLKLYCQCFAVKIYCGGNCRCLVCFNSAKHEKLRKDAMRSILSRNPTAFDTKFSKTKERKAKEPQLVLAHKLGCKCRKSACMKKYCECYAGNVKCSPNCRCIGCKNTTNHPFGQGKPGEQGLIAARDGGQASYEMPPPNTANNTGRTGREPWMMNAAQNLTFLKHGSPTSEKRVKTADAGDMGSMPSLAASSSDTSPGEKVEEGVAHKPSDKASNEPETEGNAVNTLLMAAYAMTEFQSQKVPKAPPKSSHAAEKPAGSPQNEEQSGRKVLFRPSPKRKSSDVRGPEGAQFEEQMAAQAASKHHGADVEDTGGKDGMQSSPLDPREMKRTRLGSARRKASLDKDVSTAQTSPENNASRANDASLVHETPDQKTMGPDKLTPVSARCIDFKRMHVNEKTKMERS